MGKPEAELIAAHAVDFAETSELSGRAVKCNQTRQARVPRLLFDSEWSPQLEFQVFSVAS